MDTNQKLLRFFERSRKDPRIGFTHMALYLALYCKWTDQGGETPLIINGATMRKTAKIGSSVTYYRTLRDLHEGGYLTYHPSYHKNRKSGIML